MKGTSIHHMKEKHVRQLYVFVVGSPNHIASDTKCLAWKKKCLACGKVGHFKSCCHSSKVAGDKVNNGEAHLGVADDGEKYDIFVCDCVEVNTNSDTFAAVNLSELTHDVIVNGIVISALIDTGSQLNILLCGAVPGLNVTESRAKITAWGGFPVAAAGEAILEVEYKGWRTKAKFHVVDSSELQNKGGLRPLMSYNLSRKLGMMDELANVFTVSVSYKCHMSCGELDVFAEYESLFKGVGTLCMGDKYTVTLKDNVQLTES